MKADLALAGEFGWQRRIGDVLGKLARFSADFTVPGRGSNIEGERATL